MKPRTHLAPPWVLIALGVVLALEATRLPFTAGSPATDLLAPVSALGCGIAAVVTTWKARGVAEGRWPRALATVSLVLALLLTAAAGLVLAFIFLMCGNYWARDMC